MFQSLKREAAYLASIRAASAPAKFAEFQSLKREAAYLAKKCLLQLAYRP